MRSRYAGFALRLGEYLARTLAPSHPDAGAPGLARALANGAARCRYPELVVLAHDPGGEGAEARVLFYARVFEGSREVSFVELSRFEHDGAGWRYASGDAVPAKGLPGDPRALDLASFEALLSSRA
jgi:uncharacterized protein YchJ